MEASRKSYILIAVIVTTVLRNDMHMSHSDIYLVRPSISSLLFIIQVGHEDVTYFTYLTYGKPLHSYAPPCINPFSTMA
jgi:hypothetical protein